MNERFNNKGALYAWLVCGIAALFYTYEYFLRIEPSVMAPQLMRHFAITAGGLGLLSAMYYYAYTPMQAVVGVLTDHYGPKRVLTIAIILCVVGSFLFGIPNDLYLAATGRFLIGMGSAFAFVGVLKLAAIWLPQERFSLFVGLTTSLGVLGALAGDIEMSWMVQHYGWRGVIMLGVLIGAILIPIFLLFVHERKKQNQEDEALFLSLKRLLLDFWRLMTTRQMLCAGFIGCMLFLSLTVVGEMWGIVFIKAITGETKIQAAATNSSIFLGWLVGGPVSGWLSDKIRSRRKPLIVGSILATMSITIILIWPTMNHFLLSLMLFLFGLFSSVEIICFAVGRDLVGVKLTATAMGVINLLIMLGGMILQPLAGWLLNVFWNGVMIHQVRIYAADDYRKALIIVPVGMLIAAILSFFLKESYSDGVSCSES